VPLSRLVTSFIVSSENLSAIMNRCNSSLEYNRDAVGEGERYRCKERVRTLPNAGL
jgi:hypothetical protein